MCTGPAVYDHPAGRIELGPKSRAGGISDELEQALGTRTAPGTSASDQPSATSQSAARNHDALADLPRNDRTRLTALRQSSSRPSPNTCEGSCTMRTAPSAQAGLSAPTMWPSFSRAPLLALAPGVSEDRNVPRVRAFRDAHRPRRGARRRGKAGVATVPAARDGVANGVAARAGCSRLSVGSVARALDAAPTFRSASPTGAHLADRAFSIR